jgi:methyl coenzyme M reductase subunit D
MLQERISVEIFKSKFLKPGKAIKLVKRFSSYNALFDIEKSVIEGENCLFWDENL